MNNEPVAYACQIVEADFETNILKIEMLDENYKVSAGIKYLCDTHPVKELTDEEINKLWAESHEDGIAMQQGFTTQQHYFAHLILRKAQEK